MRRAFHIAGRIAQRVALGAAAVSVLAVAANAAMTLPEYRDRIRRARAAAAERAVERLRREVPVKEHVEWEGGSIEVDNGWVVERLKAYEGTDAAAQTQILSEIAERLAAIDDAAAETERAPASGRSKDEEKQKLGEILGRPEYLPPEKAEESRLERWIREFFDWLSRNFPRVSSGPADEAGSPGMARAVQVVLFVLVIALVGFLVFRFAPFVFSRKKGDQDARGDRVILGEAVPAEMSASDLFSEAEQLARDGDLRGAIRKGYVAVLCRLGDRGVVRLAGHKTNRDYLRDVRREAGLYEAMSDITGRFERTWYGLRPPEAAEWDEFRVRCRSTLGERG